MKQYFKFCRFIQEYYARTEGEGSGENFGAFIVSTGVLNLNLLTFLGIIGFFIPKEIVQLSNILIATISFLTVALLNYLIAFKNNKYLDATENEKKMYGISVLAYIIISLLLMIIVIVLNREFFLAN